MVGHGSRAAAARAAAAAAIALAAAACSTPDRCLAGADACERADNCSGLDGVFLCAGAPELRVGTAETIAIDLEGAAGTGSDVVLQNGLVTAVIDDLASPRGLATTGGTLIDLGPRGGSDDLNNVFQLAGVLPDDTFSYESVTLVDRSPALVAAVYRGHLDGRPDVEVATRYELRACEPGLRIRSELYNGSPEPHTFVLADLAHWGKATALPFAALRGQGFLAPELELLDLQDVYFEHDYILARSTEPAAASYGFVPCDQGTLAGVNDPEVSALGTPVQIVRPGEVVSFERMIVSGGGADLDAALRATLLARRGLHVDPEPVTIRARVSAAGFPVDGSPRRAALLISADEPGGLRPLTVAIPGEDGELEAAVPPAALFRWELWSFGRPVAGGTAAGDRSIDLGDIEIDPPARVVIDLAVAGAPGWGEVVVVPADEATRAAVTGSWFGRLGSCAPWLGPPVGGSPACNRVLVEPGGADVEVPAGRYRLLATAGPEHTVAEVLLDLAPADVAAASFDLTPVPVVPAGWLGADLHVHGRASFDSSIPDRDRVISFAAHGVEVIAATDHDAVVNYAAAIESAGVGGRVIVMGGAETTSLIPFLEVPDDDLPRTIGHFNHWPMFVEPEPFGGLPPDERIEPGALFDRLAPRVGPDGIHMLNHPWDEPQFGRDLGYLRAIGFDPRVPIPGEDDGTANGMLQRAPAGGKRNIDFDLFELQNGAALALVQSARPLWFSLLSQGFMKVAAASSDSHSLGADNVLGYGRTWIETDRELATFDPTDFNRTLKSGRAVSGNGVFILASLGTGGGDRRGPRLEPYVPAGGDTVEIEVRAPPWIPVEEVRAVTAGGVSILAVAADLSHPASPLDTGPVVRYRATVPLDSLLGPGDDWLVIEAGLPLWPAADLDDDGVPDTSDNNGDGVIDERDIEDPDDDAGPLLDPPDPTDPDDPRYVLTRIVPGAWPYGFTNPFLVDRAGDGWDPPGLDR